ncbi:MAG: C45 family peptidase, partial [Coprobacillus sp.]
MEKIIRITARTLNLSGSHYEIGYQLGKMIDKDVLLKSKYIMDKTDLSKQEVTEANELFEQWCPGLCDEIAGFADALNIKREDTFFYSMTYLIPRCSQIALQSHITNDNKPLLARNYEFSHELEDFCLFKTSVDGKYTHMGTSMLLFGIDDGFNEHGLTVTITSCGMPVVKLEHMRKPAIKGLQYWVVIRALLENCKNVEEALNYLKGMPIAFNMNMVLLDKSDHIALVQTMDGHHAIKHINHTSKEYLLYTTNHSILPQLQYLEPQVFAHSIARYQYIENQFKQINNITRDKLKDMLLSKYPNGLCFHNFTNGFGTTKSMIMSPIEGTIELCWGGQEENGWRTYNINKPLNNETYEIDLHDEAMV